MFLIKSKLTDFKEVWNNRVEDDFLQFVPSFVYKTTGIKHTKDDLDISIIQGDREFLEHLVGSDDKDIIVEDGKCKRVKRAKTEADRAAMKSRNNGKDYEDAVELTTKKLKRWPYHATEKDSKGRPKFMGNEAE